MRFKEIIVFGDYLMGLLFKKNSVKNVFHVSTIFSRCKLQHIILNITDSSSVLKCTFFSFSDESPCAVVSSYI